MSKRLIVLLAVFLIGCTKEPAQAPTAQILNAQILKIADCGDNLVVSYNDTLAEYWSSDEYADWRDKYNIKQFFFHPFQCSDSELCSYYSTAVIVQDNCSIYYIDTSILEEGLE